jgi:hypothetical protein
MEIHKSTLSRCNACNIIIKDRDAHSRTSHHYFCYEGIKAGYKHATYTGLTKYVDTEPEEISKLVNQTFDFKKWHGKDLFTPAVRVEKKTVPKAKKPEPVVEENDDTHTNEINKVINKITEIIDDDHKDQFEALLELPDDINKYNKLDELLLTLEDIDTQKIYTSEC